MDWRISVCWLLYSVSSHVRLSEYPNNGCSWLPQSLFGYLFLLGSFNFSFRVWRARRLLQGHPWPEFRMSHRNGPTLEACMASFKQFWAEQVFIFNFCFYDKLKTWHFWVICWLLTLFLTVEVKGPCHSSQPFSWPPCSLSSFDEESHASRLCSTIKEAWRWAKGTGTPALPCLQHICKSKNISTKVSPFQSLIPPKSNNLFWVENGFS